MDNVNRPVPTGRDRKRPVRFNSRTRPGETYTVRFPGSGGVVCTCPGFYYRMTCRHVEQTLARLEEHRCS